MRHFAALATSSVVDAWFNPMGDVLTNAKAWPSLYVKGYRDWKHATKAKKDFPKHADSKDHLACCVKWND